MALSWFQLLYIYIQNLQNYQTMAKSWGLWENLGITDLQTPAKSFVTESLTMGRSTLMISNVILVFDHLNTVSIQLILQSNLVITCHYNTHIMCAQLNATPHHHKTKVMLSSAHGMNYHQVDLFYLSTTNAPAAIQSFNDFTCNSATYTLLQRMNLNEGHQMDYTALWSDSVL